MFVFDLVYGQSVIDVCIGWDDLVKVLEMLVDVVCKCCFVLGSGN